MKFNKIENGIVIDIIEAEQSFIDTLVGIYVQSNSAYIGQSYDGINFIIPIIVLPTLAENQATKLTHLNEYINTQKKALEAPYSQISIESFTQKKNEALAWSISNTATTPYIDMLCTDVTGTLNTVARDVLIQVILVKVQGIAQLEAFEDATRTAIKATTTQAELDTVVIP